MQITFNPHDADDLAVIARLLGTTASTAPAPAAAPETPAQPEAPSEPAPASDAPDDSGPDPETLDIHGMAWREDIHSNPPSMNADGSWRAKRGKKDEYEAAIAAHKAAADPEPQEHPEPQEQPAAMPAPAAMPTSMPAAPAPATPPEPIAYEAMAKRFVGMMSGNKLPAPYETIYAALEVSVDDLQVNQTSIARLWHYMDAVDNGEAHDGATRHAMGSVG